MKKSTLFTFVVGVLFYASVNAQEGIIGEIRMFAGNYAPNGWAFCNGQVLSIASNSQLFVVIGTSFGGNGTSTFALPDLRGRVPVGFGNGPGLTNYTLGQESGTETKTLTTQNIPTHSHNINIKAVSELGNTNSPENNYFANTGIFDNEYRAAGTEVNMKQQSTESAGNGTAVDIRQPSLAINFIICVSGTFPAQN